MCGQPIRLVQGSGERSFTQLTHGLCFLFIAKSIAKLWLLLLPQVDRPGSLLLELRAKTDFCIQISIELKIKIAKRVVNRFA